MAKQLNVSLAFTADTSQAKKQLQDLQKELTQLMKTSSSNVSGFDLTKDIMDATKAAGNLKSILQQATTSSGTLDISRFNEGLNKSGIKLSEYANKLNSLGPAGQHAFAQIAQAVLSADVPLRRTNNLLNEFKTTLMNTARWQISSSILHGFMGSLQSAYGYAQDLNQSLNNIRIVTGYSSDEMAQFAERANKAAQDLSTTTTNYTDAALIYYQQGIRDQEEIAARTETTIKLANVSRQSAEDVSSQMTAIWNNFDDGSKSLEYYADVITALGANTASSSQEIAKGMQQFAAVADTVGLSYEYAAASLATIVATTRQSESTVGNGLRTIFSRLEGLKLGDTLEDGTDLNKYSQALATVGVNIKDASGELKDMDTILEETASKWDQLDKAQKVAFATTVGGVRQYTNLIALLDNWDMVQENIDIAKGSEGTLQEQANIYEESWEASSKRVKAALEDIYKTLLNDKFFISLNDGFASFLKLISSAIDGLGGLSGVLTLISTLMFQAFGKEITASIDNLFYNLTFNTEQAKEKIIQLRQQMIGSMRSMIGDDIASSTNADIYELQGQAQDALLLKTQQLAAANQSLSESQKAQIQQGMDLISNMGSQVSALAEKRQAEDDLTAALEKQIRYEIGSSAFEQMKPQINFVKELTQRYFQLISATDKFVEGFANAGKSVEEQNKAFESMIPTIEHLKESFKGETSTSPLLNGIYQNIEALDTSSVEAFQLSLGNLRDTIFTLGDKSKEEFQKLRDGLTSLPHGDAKALIGILDKMAQSLQNAGEMSEEQRAKMQRLTEMIKILKGDLEGMQPPPPSVSESFTALLGAVSSLGMALSSLKGIMSTLGNENISPVEKFISVVSSLAITIPMLTRAFKAFNKEKAVSIGLWLKNAFSTQTYALASNEAAIANGALAVSEEAVLLPLQGILIGITAISAALLIWAQYNKDVAESHQKLADKSREAAESASEESEKNRELISSMTDLLKKYEEDETVKDDLDEITRKLAEAYDVEGAALARLSGNYKDYQKVLEEAQKAQVKELEGLLKNEQQAANHQAQVVLDKAKSGKGAQFGDTYTLDFSGNYNSEDDVKWLNILKENVGLGELELGNDVMSFGINIDVTNPDELITLYHQLLDARTAMESLNDPNLVNNTIYKDLSKWIDKMSKDVQEYETHLEKIKEYSIQLGQLDGMTISEKDVKTFKDYNKWITEATAGLKKIDEDISEDEVNNVINELINNSINPDLKKFQTYAEAIKEIIALNKDIPEDGLQKLFESEEYDAAAIGVVNWATVTSESYEEACKAAQKYIDQLEIIRNSSTEGDSIEKAITDYGKGLTKSNTPKLAEDINWGQKEDLENGKQAIIDFTTFVHMKKDEQKKYLDDLLNTANEIESKSLEKAIEYETEKIAENEAIRKKFTDEQAAWAADHTADVETVRNAFERTNGNKEDFTVEEKNALSRSGGGDAKTLDEYNEKVSETAARAKEWNDTITESDNKVQSLTDSLNKNKTEQAQVNLNQAYNCKTLDELNQKVAKGIISQKDYEATMDSVISTELSSLKISEETFKQHAKSLQENVKGLEGNEVAAKKLALANLKVQQGLKNLGKNIDTYTANLVDSKKDTLEYAESMDSAKDVMSQILEVSKEKIDDDFITKHFEDIKLAADDDVEALERLREAANKEIVCDIKINNDEITSQIDEVLDNLEAEDLREIKIGTSIDSVAALDDFTQLLNDMAAQAAVEGQDISDQLTDALNSINFDPEIDYDELQLGDADTAESETTGYVTIPSIHTTADGTIESSTTQIPVSTYQQAIEQGLTTIKVPRINGKGTKSKGGVSSGASTGHKGKGSGGGGGGGSKPKAAKTKDYADPSKDKKKEIQEKEKERYYEINNQLKTTEQLLNKINTAKDRAFGRNKIAQIDKENKALDKQIQQYNTLIKEDKEWLEVDKKRLAEYKVSFDIDGNMTNYDEIFEIEKQTLLKAVDDYDVLLKKAVDDYNAAMAQAALQAEETREKMEKEIEKTYKDAEKDAQEFLDTAQKRFDHFQEYSDQYHTTLQKIEDDIQKQQELRNQVYDNELQKITYIVELRIDIKDRDIALLQDYLEDIGDKADGATDAIANFGEQLDKTLDKVDEYTDEVSKILEHAGADDDLIDDVLNGTFDEDQWDDILSIGQDGKGLNEEEIEKLKSAADALLSMNKELRQLREEALKKTGEAFDEFNEKLERGVSQIEHLTKVTQTYRDVLDIVGKNVLDRNGKLTSALNEQAYNIQRNHTHALQAQLDFIDSALDDAQRLYDEAVQNGYNQQVLDSLRADVEKYEDQRQNTYESWLDSWKEECQLAKDYYEDTLNQILQNFEDAIAGQFKNLSNLSEEFARKNEISSIYVEDYEKIYQLSKLTRDINNSLDDSTTLASKGKLRDIQKEINALQESGLEVSQYDLDVLRKKYEMAIAYEQWQDAQNAKTVVRMQRDNEGNYGYVYTADQSNVEAAEQNYEDKLHEMQVLNAEYIQSLQEQIIQAQQNCADALANLRAEDYASYEEYQAAVEQIRSDYTERIQTLSQQMEKALDNNRNLYETDWTEYSKATGYKISADEEYIDKFEETVYSQLTGFQTMEEAQSAFVDAVNDASDAAAESWEDWYIRTNTALDDAGLSMQNFTDEVSDRVEELGEDAERAEEDIWNMSDEFADAYSDISDTVGNFLGEYSNYIDAMIDYNQALVDSINDVLRAYAELEGSEFDNNQNDVIEGDWTPEYSEDGTVITGWTVKDKKTGQAVNGQGVKISWAGDKYTQGYTATYDVVNGKMITEGKNAVGTGIGGTNTNEYTEKDLEWLRKNKMATGGYTGEWGDSSGRLAVLHEKELVLNSDDTANILSAVDMIRSISNAIDLNALAAGAVFAGRGAAVVSSFGNDTLEQNVHITAEFPSVSDHNEIEEALNSLVERAAQFAGRKKF